VISSRKKRTILVVAIVVVSLVAVAVPFCADAFCAQSSSPGPSRPLHMFLPSMLQPAAIVGCDMVMAARSGLDGMLPPLWSDLLQPLAGILALVAMTALLFEWVSRRRGAAFARILSPPGDLRGVRLLI
jgi:hypothetical protein